MKKTIEKRSAIIFEIRKFFMNQGYTEVETPIRLPSIIPEDHIEPFLSEDFFLQASPEICMKRLLSRGHKKIFQICKTFRKNERGRLHIPEMTMLEWYHAGRNYLDLMKETEDLIT
ncbi:MAG: amino acid--tRNA ligase-related protein, partial [Desulfobacteraceae bacterium]